MKNIGILIEVENNHIKETNYGVITLARKEGATLSALVTARVDDSEKEHLSRYGIDTIVDITLPDSVEINPVARAKTLAAAVKELDLEIILGLSSGAGKDLIPRVAALLDAPLVMDCMDLDLGRNIGVTSQYSGKVMARIQLTGERVMFGVRPNAVPAKENPVESNHMAIQSDQADPDDFKVLAREVSGTDTDQVSLAEADIIIAGGRGMKAKENFGMLFECAKKMKAAVGASRVAVDQDWISYAHQVGQTGEKVSPSVYIACGISGSIQHFAGMKTAKMIIAMNTDENAAIMANCDYCIKGDLFEIIPELTRRL